MIMKKIFYLAIVSSLFFFSCSDDDKDDIVVPDNGKDTTSVNPNPNPEPEPNPEPVTPTLHEGHEYVDLGLPSGALWSAYEDVSVDGMHFFSWGETSPKAAFSKDAYLLQNGRDSALTKYCTMAQFGDNGFTDGLLELQPEDDPALYNWGGNWRMPNWEEWKEMFQNCTWNRFDYDSTAQAYIDSLDNVYTGELRVEPGISFFVGTSKNNGNKIIIPMTGAMIGTRVTSVNQGCAYWSSTLLTDSCNHVASWTMLGKGSLNGKCFVPGKRTVGHNVRAVIPGDRKKLWDDAQMVDLGLPSGIKWAKTNIGALDNYKSGVYYAWGEIVPKKMYNFEDYKYCSEINADGSAKTLSKYILNEEWGAVDNIAVLEDGDDAAKQAWGNGWRMPTMEEVQELLDNCTHETVTLENVGNFNSKTYKEVISGTKFTGPNGNSIFLPWVGTMYNGELEYPERAYYWTSTLSADDSRWAEGLFMSAKMCQRGNQFFRCSGRLIRPVHD